MKKYLFSTAFLAGSLLATDLPVVDQAFINGGKKADTAIKANVIYLKGSKQVGYARKPYLAFDASNKPVSVGEAELKVSVFRKNKATGKMVAQLFGLNDGHAGDAPGAWKNGQITWNNAPGNNPQSGSDMKRDEMTLLAEVVVEPSSKVVVFKNANLARFINADKNGALTFAIAAKPNNQSCGFSSHKWGKYNTQLKVVAGDNPAEVAVGGIEVVEEKSAKSATFAESVKVWDGVGKYRESIKQKLGANSGNFLIGADESSPAKYVKSKNGKQNLTEIAVEGQPFSSAMRLTVANKCKMYWDAGGEGNIPGSVRKGDVIYATFYVRSVKSAAESGQSVFYFVLKGSGKIKGDLLRKYYSAGKDWQQFHIATRAKKDFPAGSLRLHLWTGDQLQVLDVGGLSVVNLGSDFDMAKLPKTEYNLKYQGSEAGAQWRKDAAKRIEKYRKGDMKLKVVDANGKPLAGKKVKIAMTQHDFKFGFTLSAKGWYDKNAEKRQQYRNAVNKMLTTGAFNSTVLENALKPLPAKGKLGFKKEKTKELLQWCKDQGLRVRGHTFNWGPRYLTKEQQEWLKNKQADPLQKSLLEHIESTIKFTDGYIDAWDVTNEHYTYPSLTNCIGKQAAVEWFKKAKECLPENVTLFWNENGILSNSPQSHLKRAHSMKWVKYLKDSGAPIYGIGMQSHIGTGATPPKMLLEQLDNFAALGVKIESTEFDVGIPDAKDPKQREYQAKYISDFMTVLFSHPAVIGINYWSPIEKRTYTKNAHIFTTSGKPVNGGENWVKLVTKDWWTDVELVTDVNGEVAVRGFKGKYQVLVDNKKQVNVSLQKETSLTIRLK